MPTPVDFLIVGQGLAGSLLGWELRRRGRRVLLVDRDAPVSASRTAAGLINPVTGMRLVKQPDAERLLDAAEACYRRAERELGRPLLHPLPLVRLIADPRETETLNRRLGEPGYADLLAPPAPPGRLGYRLRDEHGSFVQRRTGYLDTEALLDGVADTLRAEGAWRAGTVAFDELAVTADGVAWRDVRAQAVVFCEGWRGGANPWFDWLPFQPAKGEILALRGIEALPPFIVRGSHWLLPRSDGSYRLGATYERDTFDERPTPAARERLLAGLAGLFHTSPAVSVSGQLAGVRPGTRDRAPFLGRHPAAPRVAIFNGCGSKGSLLLPWHAAHLADHLIDGAPLSPAIDIRRFWEG